MSTPVTSSTPPDIEPPERPATQTVRTYKDAADAEKAQAVLKKEGIEATILELAMPPGHQQRATGGVRLVVDTEDAARATQLLLRDHRERHSAGLTRSQRRIPRPSVPQTRFSTTALFLIIGITGAAFATWYITSQFGGAKKTPVNKSKQPDRVINEDLNHDGKIDCRRIVNGTGVPVREEWDLNFDGKWELRRNYTNGRLSVSAIDTDGNGITDEETYYDSLGRPFYSQVIPNGKGAVARRTFYQDADEFELPETEEAPENLPNVGDMLPLRILFDDDADGFFDREQTFDIKGKSTERKLEKDPANQAIPPFP